jgi:hypothetical protein
MRNLSVVAILLKQALRGGSVAALPSSEFRQFSLLSHGFEP